MSPNQRSFRRHAINWALALFLTLALMVLSAPLSQPQKANAAASPNGTIPLLLIHGYADNCNLAFNNINGSTYKDANGNSTPGSNASTAQDYFANHGWLTIDKVGYYNNSHISDHTATCNSYMDGYAPSHQKSDQNGVSHCKALLGSYALDSLDDPIQHLGCLLAWYIYDTYTLQNRTVDILAHSMGGLIVRDALGQSGFSSQVPDSHFPPPLDVQRVVTVATPDGGVGGTLNLLGHLSFPGNEVSDMAPGSGFMNLMGRIQKPQGSSGTFWGLVGASDTAAPRLLGSGECPISGYPSGSLISCIVPKLVPAGDRYPDSDGVVQAASMMAMKADYKVLYGAIDDYYPNTVASPPYIADVNTEYEHEASTCSGQLPVLGRICLSAPFYLNDAAPDSQLTKAWICSGNCNSTDFTDLNITQAAPSAYHSLAEIAWLLAPSTHINTNQITYQQPGEAYFNGWLYTCWVGLDGTINLGYSSDNAHFQYDTPINDTSIKGCSLAGFNNRLYLAFTGTDNRIYIEYTTDGFTFQNHIGVPDTSYAPAQIANFKGNLYLAFTGTDGTIYTESYDGNTTFANHRALPAYSDTNVGPAINAFLGDLYVAWSGTDSSHSINLTYSNDGSNFASPLQIPGATSNSGPALTNVDSILYIGWRGMDPGGHLNVKPMDIIGTFQPTDTLSDTTDTAPALAAFNDRIVWAWSGTDNPPHLNVASEY